MMFVFIVYFLRINHFDKSICVTCDLEDSETGSRFVSNQAQGRGHEKRDIWCHDATMQRQKVISFFHSPTKTLFVSQNMAESCYKPQQPTKCLYFSPGERVAASACFTTRARRSITGCRSSLVCGTLILQYPWGRYWVGLEEIYTN